MTPRAIAVFALALLAAGCTSRASSFPPAPTTPAGVTASSSPPAVQAAAEVRACMTQHSLPFAHTITREGVTLVEERCQWPPSSATDQSGYSWIRADTVTGPGTSEASDANLVTRIDSTCPRVQIRAAIEDQGVRTRLPDAIIDPGTTTSMDHLGRLWHGDLGFYPDDGHEADIVHNSSFALLDARCVGS